MSILIPMHNEERWIGRCIESITQNDLAMDQYEIIVLDGRSTDRSREIVKEKSRSFPNIQLVDNRAQFVPQGLNLGISKARGRYILIFGAHVEYPLNYVRACVRELEEGAADVVGGALVTMPGDDTSVARAIALMTQHPFGVGNSHFRLGHKKAFVDTVPYGAYRRELFERCGGYREDLLRNQDLELSARLRSNGARILLLSEPRPVYRNVATMSKLVRQAYGNGLWLGRCWIWYPVSFSWRHAAPGTFLFVLLTCALATLRFHALAFTLLSVLGSYFISALLSATQLARRNGSRYFFLLPPLFFVYHVAYGIGTLAGLISSPVHRRVQQTG